MQVRREGRALGAAFTFLTRLPIGRLASHDPADLPASSAYFPIVGLAIGMFSGAAYAIAVHWWSPPLAVLLSMIAGVVATGAFHEDALADSLDAFGGGWTREQVLTIMKDSRVGSYALVGAWLMLAVKFAALSSIAATLGMRDLAVALVVGHTLGRWSSLPLIRAYPYVRLAAPGERPSAGRPFVDSVPVLRFAVATTIAATIVATALGSRAVPPIVVAVLITWLSGRYFAARIGGITGDALGAANQIVEVGAYLTLAAMRR